MPCSPLWQPQEHLCGAGDGSLKCSQGSTLLNLWLQKWARSMCGHMKMVHVYKPVHVPHHPYAHTQLSLITRIGLSCSLWSHDRSRQINGVYILNTKEGYSVYKTLEQNDRWCEMVSCTHHLPLVSRELSSCCVGGVTQLGGCPPVLVHSSWLRDAGNPEVARWL